MYLFIYNSELFPSKVRVLTIGSSYCITKVVLAFLYLVPNYIFSLNLHVIVISFPFSILAFGASFFITQRKKTRKLKN